MRPTTATVLSFLAILVFAVFVNAVSLGVVSTSPSSTSITLTVNQPTIFSITVNDTSSVNYAWHVNSTVQQNGSSNQFTFTPNSTGSADIKVIAFKTSDTSDLVSHTWNAVIQAGVLGLSASPSFTLGGENQKSSNIESERIDAHDIFVERSLRLTNTDANTITGLNVSIEGAGGFTLVGDLNLTVSIPQTTIGGGSSIDVTLHSRVPDRLDAVNGTNFKSTAPQVATLTFRAQLANGTQTTTTTSVNIQRKNMLVINDIDVCVETDCEDAGTDSVIQNVKPGDQVDIEVRVESLYSTGEDEDLDIQDVELSFAVDEDELTEDESEDLGDIGARDEDIHTFTLDIPDDLDSGIYDVLVTVIGKDENGAFHGDVQEFKLDIDRKGHDVSIQSLFVNPQTVNLCNQRTFTLTINSQNIGESDEDEGALSIRNSDLDIDRRIGPFLLEQDLKRTDTMTLTVPSRITGGDFTILVKSYFDKDKQTDEEGVIVDLEACETESSAVTSPEPANTSDTQTRNSSATTRTQQLRSTERTLGTPTTSTTRSKSAGATISPVLVLGIVFGILVFLLVVALIVLRRK